MRKRKYPPPLPPLKGPPRTCVWCKRTVPLAAMAQYGMAELCGDDLPDDYTRQPIMFKPICRDCDKRDRGRTDRQLRSMAKAQAKLLRWRGG
jgi:hypothetical protein